MADACRDSRASRTSRWPKRGILARAQLAPSRLAIACASFLLLTAGPDRNLGSKPALSPIIAATSQKASQRLTDAGVASLQQILAAGELSDLHWTEFGTLREPAGAFYKSRGYTLAWIGGEQPTPQARAVMDLLERAELNGLDALDYDGPLWSGRRAWLRPENPQPNESGMIRFDVALTVCTMRYASDLHLGRVDPQAFGFGPGADRQRFDLAQFLQSQAINSPDVPATFEQIEPPYEGYRRTKQALQTYLALQPRDDAPPLPEPPRPVRPGDSYAGTPRLVQRLRLVGDLPAGTRLNDQSLVYTGALVSALKRFQLRHGLDPDGRLGPQTLAQLNTPIRARVLQLQLTLERWRWLPTRFDEPPIIVNIPEFVLRAMDEDFHAALTMKVVVGMAVSRETPTFAARMSSVEFRPYWNVPLSIQRDEIVPDLERDPGYLARNDYEITNSRGEPVDANPRRKAVREKLRSGQLLIRQLPGPRNALGFVKFDFPNRYGIYLHGTPSRELFARPRRAFSHGCIRAEKPAELAAWVLRKVPGWDLDRVRAAMNGDQSVRVELKETIPVLIVYGTAIVLQNDEVHFFQDVYARDAALEQALSARHTDHR